MNKRRVVFVLGFLGIFALGAVSSLVVLRRCAVPISASEDNFTAFHSWAHSLGLTSEQEAKIEPMEKTLRKDLNGIQSRLSEERMALCSLMHQSAGTSSQMNARLEKICDLEKEQQKRVVDHLMGMKAVMTKDQQGRFFQAMMKQLCPHCRQSAGKEHASCKWCSLKK